MKTENQQCYCGNDDIEIRAEVRRMEILGKKYDIHKQYCHCPQCGEEWVTPAQSKTSTDQIITIKRRAQGYLAPQDIKELRKKHSLSQKQAATIFGGGENAFSKYERGEIYPSTAMDKLMRLFDEVPQAKNYLLYAAGAHDEYVTFVIRGEKNKKPQINIGNLKEFSSKQSESKNETGRNHATL